MRDSEPQRDRHHERELWRSEIALVARLTRGGKEKERERVRV